VWGFHAEPFVFFGIFDVLAAAGLFFLPAVVIYIFLFTWFLQYLMYLWRREHRWSHFSSSKKRYNRKQRSLERRYRLEPQQFGMLGQEEEPDRGGAGGMQDTGTRAKGGLRRRREPNAPQREHRQHVGKTYAEEHIPAQGGAVNLDGV
jgi:hypothetical protein